MESQAQRHPWLPGLLVSGAQVRDSPQEWPVESRTPCYHSSYLGVTEDVIIDPSGAQHSRVVVQPHGAVAILALDDADNVLLLEQFRHPVAHRMIELPAGTLDVAGESGVRAAQRELREEADLDANSWESLIKLTASPGYSTELWEVFIARDLCPVRLEDRLPREAEEADMKQVWMPVVEAIEAISQGRISDALTVAGLLALRGL